MEQKNSPDILSQMINFARIQSKRTAPFADNLSAIRLELRQRRKNFLGSYISLQALVRTAGAIDENKIRELSRYLTSKTMLFWKRKDYGVEPFCISFYELAIYAISSGEVGDESVDDIIQLAECLVRSRSVFITVMKNLLPADRISELFSLTEEYPDGFFSASFEDAVLGAVSVFLGVLELPGEACGAERAEEV